MARASFDPWRQADDLIAELQRKAAQSAQDMLARATQDAAAIVRSGRDKAIRQLRRTRAELAAARAQVLGEVTAGIEAAQRARAAARTQQELAAAWPMLERALMRRWDDAAGRRRWIDATVMLASKRVAFAPWRIRFAAAAPGEVQEEIRRALGEHEITGATLMHDRSIAAGLVVECAGATLDATVPGLLVDRAAVAGALCAEVGRWEGR